MDVTFRDLPANASIEASCQRWVARLEPSIAIERAAVTIERAGRRRTTVRLTLVVAGGDTPTAATTHDDVYVAVSDVFRSLRRSLLERCSRT